ncbi:MAG: uroporphyrinogen decarboxylase family protein [Candidatus Latescibacteria bacterium]|jgi:uroporphyrinogen decarboxylase|nr:uroporphyrinogen decarboxylase family protein [Candidatus Latescibacterota bacterium]
MNSKERVHAALRREPVDRVPVFMWFHPDTAARLGQVLEIPAGCVAEVMGNDVRQTWVSNNHAMEGITHEHDGESHVDDWGIEWVKVGPFNQIRRSPLEDASEAEIADFTHPYDRMGSLLANMDPVVEDADDWFIGCDVSPCLFEMVSRVRGMEQATMDLADGPGVADRMLDDAEAFAIEVSKKACDRFPLDWLWTGDDVAGQQAMVMSPACWREKIRPRLERIFEVGKSRDLWVAYHCCGALRPIIPDLVEIGMDVLNPVQCNCPGMDPGELKREFGRDLAFMGGVDTQGLLPNGTADEVRRGAERLVETMSSDGGGFILAASHAVPPEAPMENVFAMYEAIGLGKEEILDRAADIRSRDRKSQTTKAAPGQARGRLRARRGARGEAEHPLRSERR